MKKTLLILIATLAALCATAQQTVNVKWSLSDKDNLNSAEVTGDGAWTGFVTGTFAKGRQIPQTATMTGSNAAEGYTAVAYEPPFTAFTPSTRVTGRTTGHYIRLYVKPETGHTFYPKRIRLDAAKVGTDGGNFDVCYRVGNSGDELVLAAGIAPLRNKIDAGNATGFSHYEYDLTALGLMPSDQIFNLYLYIYNLNGTAQNTEEQVLAKSMAFRNVVIEGSVDEVVYTAGDFIRSIGCSTLVNAGEDDEMRLDYDLTELVKDLKDGETVQYAKRLYAHPDRFTVNTAEGCTCNVSYSDQKAKVTVYEGDEEKFSFCVAFNVQEAPYIVRGKPLNRGLMALSLSGAGMGTGNLVSWRHRESDGYGVKYKLYRGTAAGQTVALNNGKYITTKTNFRDAAGTASSYYKLEVYNQYGQLLETEVSRKTWDNQTMTIKTNRPANSVHGASYTPNDASFCDMDGDGEYEIILKWSPSDEKDAASSGTTSEAIFDCYKLDGTQLWRIRTGNNFFTSAHTIQFIAWDLNGDGFGEFMMKTGPGTIDGEGKYVVMGNDDPKANWLNSRGKQVEGPEYITVFNGTTGAEISTIPYHTKYGDVSTGIWGDEKQNRSERYLAAIAWLDGPDANPSPIFARGYYSGAFVAAYDFDGTTLKQRWKSSNTVKNQGLWGEGCHWISVGDCDGDSRQEIIYGSGALDHDGSLLYRTGLGHGDALHLGDFIPEREGMEVFMVHEEKPYGYDLRDAKTGAFIHHVTAGGDTGRGLAAHFDSSSPHSQFIYSASGGMFDCLSAAEIASSWAIGSSGAGINCRIYWDGDLYDEFFDKSIIAHWNPTGKYFDRYKFNNGNYVWGKLNNYSKNNPCVLGDILGDWREEIVTWNEADCSLNICATSYESSYRIPHLMDDLNYRAQVIAQNVCYNQPPHLSFDPSVKYKGNPNVAQQEDLPDPMDVDEMKAAAPEGENLIYDLAGRRLRSKPSKGFYILGGKTYLAK